MPGEDLTNEHQLRSPVILGQSGPLPEMSFGKFLLKACKWNAVGESAITQSRFLPKREGQTWAQSTAIP